MRVRWMHCKGENGRWKVEWDMKMNEIAVTLMRGRTTFLDPQQLQGNVRNVRSTQRDVNAKFECTISQLSKQKRTLKPEHSI